jgi:hypothetical protein
MCMTQRKVSDKLVSLVPQSAFKIFSLNKEGQLQSVFVPTFKPGLVYPPNQRIRVDAEDAAFFAFEDFKTAVSIARQGRKRWNMVNGDLIVLPVTMHEMVATGKYHVPSEDVQCLDGYYPAFESKEIEVHDSEENRNIFYDAVLSHWLKTAQYGMSKIDKKAFAARIPHLAEVLK